jgi:hypothetical protein
LEQKAEELQERWKTVNEDKAIELYLEDSDSAAYRWP